MLGSTVRGPGSAGIRLESYSYNDTQVVQVYIVPSLQGSGVQVYIDSQVRSSSL